MDMNIVNIERIKALVRRGFNFLTEQELELAASAFVIEATTPKYGDNLPDSQFDGYREYLTSGLCGWGGSLTYATKSVEEIIRITDPATGRWCYSNRDYIEIQDLDETKYRIKNRLNNFFSNNVVKTKFLSSGAFHTVECNGWHEALDIEESKARMARFHPQYLQKMMEGEGYFGD